MGIVKVTEADTAQTPGAWEAIAARTTGPGTAAAIIEANGGHPDQRPAVGDEIEVPGYDETENDESTETPAPNTALRGKLPDDFPGRDALAKAGYDTYGKVRALGDATDVPGIGPATAAKIAAALAADTESGSDTEDDGHDE